MMMNNKMNEMLLSHLPIRPSSREILQMAGYVTTVGELLTVKEKGGIATLAAELQVPSYRALSIVQEVIEAMNGGNNNSNNNNNINGSGGSSSNTMARTAKSILDERKFGRGNLGHPSHEHIITFCRALDQILGGGIPLGQVSEIVGGPGSGKTLLATQLAVNVTMPAVFGGVDGHTIYIDTEGSFAPERCYTLADQLIRHIQAGVVRRKVQQQHGNDDDDHHPWQDVTPEDILARIHVYRTHSLADLVAVLDKLEAEEEMSDDHVNVPSLPQRRQSILHKSNCRLLVIDSIALPFRSVPPDVVRTRLLARVAARLTQWATEYHLAVVCINQRTTTTTDMMMTTTTTMGHSSTITNNNNNKNSMVGGGGTAALGATWAHAVANRLTVSCRAAVDQHHYYDTNDDNNPSATNHSNKREAILVKSTRMPIGTAEFLVTEAGIRGVEYVVPPPPPPPPRCHSGGDGSATNDPLNKRPRLLLLGTTTTTTTRP